MQSRSELISQIGFLITHARASRGSKLQLHKDGKTWTDINMK